VDVDVAAIVEQVIAARDEERLDEAWRRAGELVEAHSASPVAARTLAFLLQQGAFDRERGLELATALFEAHADDTETVAELGSALEAVDDVRYLNAAPPEHPVFTGIARRLQQAAATVTDTAELDTVLRGLATAASVLGRSWDQVAEDAYVRLVALRPERWQDRYNLGLYYKTRGRFAEGQQANEEAAARGGADDDGVRWNLGICATGAGDGVRALQIWKQLGNTIEMGRFGLPEGRYASVKIRLAERPLAERGGATVADDPGAEETIWIERLSPCHGIVRSALYQDEIGVDYGDVILFDGAPITYHTYGDKEVPVFPHLATLVRADYRIYRFAGTQRRKEQVADLSRTLPADGLVYVHTEQFVQLCHSCWERFDSEQHDHRQVEHHVVTGKICVPSSVEPAAIRAALDDGVAGAEGVELYVPELSRELGEHARAEVEERRMRMIASA
jgi:hypothetical protein